MAILQKCCFCIPLTTGAVAMGTFYFVWFCFMLEDIANYIYYEAKSWYWWTLIFFLIANVISTIMLIYASVRVSETALSLKVRDPVN